MLSPSQHTSSLGLLSCGRFWGASPRALSMHIMQQSHGAQPADPLCDAKSEDVPPPLTGSQSTGQAYAAGWVLGVQHRWFCSSSPLGRGRSTCQCRQSRCSSCTQDRGTTAVHTTVGGSGGDRSPLRAAFPLCARAFASAATALLGIDRCRLVFAFYLSFALICNF